MLKPKKRKEIADIWEKLTKVKEDIDQLQTDVGKFFSEVIIILSAPDKQQVEFQLSYVIHDAGWSAAYDVRVDSAKGVMELTYYGVITNSTGEDWKETQVVLSTAKPSIGGAPPKCPTERVTQWYPPVYEDRSWDMIDENSSFKQKEITLSKTILAKRSLREQPKQPALKVLTSTATEGVTSVAFNIPRAATILSDNKPHKITITVISLNATFTYSCVPRYSPQAYLKATVTNTTEKYPFLAGKLNVFMNGDFITKSSIQSVAPKEKFSVFLGVDERIQVKYQPPVIKHGRVGIISKSNSRNMVHKIIIQNNKDSEIAISVYAQLPLSESSQIKVRLDSPEINPNEAHPTVTLSDANIVKWKEKIPAKNKITIPFAYTIEYPNEEIETYT